ncbi:MAG: hypothetical protein Q7U97_04945 [Rhodocyclaceae bacterium]|nr:hypothetical protein [Rhodocyclaceae bacterium]
MTDADDQAELEKQEQAQTNQAHRRRHRIDNFLTLARNAQNARDKREQDEQRLLDLDRKTWDETIEQILEIRQQHEQDFDR